MPRGKIDLEKIRASLEITPAEIMRASFYEIQCPKCGELFNAAKTKAQQR
jgi:ribosomal protein S27E